MKLAELFEKARIAYPLDRGDIEIKNIVTDSRYVCEGSAFICISGAHYDGHDYIGEAIDKGAVVIVAEQVRDDCVGGAAAIYVENTRRAAALLYNAWYGDPARDMKLIAVTGTNGKTSVTYMLKHIFEFAGYKCGVIGTIRCLCCGKEIESISRDQTANMTTPDPEELYRLLGIMRDHGAEYVFIEASSHALALSKLDALRFDTAIFTNLTRDHLDFHGDMERYFAAKAKLFNMCEKAFINADDSYSERLLALSKCKKIYTTSTHRNADIYAENIKISHKFGCRYLLRSKEGDTEIKISSVGRFFVTNSLQAAAVALSEGIAPLSICKAFEEFRGVDGRMEKVELGECADISVVIDYAHTPDAFENLLRSIRDVKDVDGRIIFLFGCGGERDRSKRREMAHIASRFSDVVIVTSDNSRGESPERIISDILRGIDKEKEYKVIKNRESAIEYAVRVSRTGDIIVLAGKGHERYEIDDKGKHPFDEREIVRRAYLKYK